jgi:hypothetical protein
MALSSPKAHRPMSSANTTIGKCKAATVRRAIEKLFIFTSYQPRYS